LGWSLAITAPGREFPTARLLSHWAHQHILFKVKRRLLYHGTIIDVLRPAFPRYLFISAEGAWTRLREQCSGIIDFVREDGHIAIVPDGLVRSLLATAPDAIIPMPVVSPRFQFGDQVIIRGNGILAGQQAIFQQLVDAESAIVLLPWLGREIPTRIHEQDLLKAIEVPKPHRKRRRRRRKRSAPAPAATLNG
jgi:hypothetical protein